MATKRIKRLVNLAIIALLFLLAAFSLYRSITNALGMTGSGSSIDFHSYWDPGHAVLRGIDPYPAPLRGERNTVALGLPSAEDGEDFVYIASNAPLQLLLLSPLSLLNWPTARLVWMLINLALAAGVIWVAARLFPQKFTRTQLVVAGLVFLATLPTRNAIANGQPVLLVMLATLLAALIAPRKPWLAGLLYGIALSKYSLVLPVALWFLAFGYGGVVAIALGVQLAGVLLLALITRTAPLVLVGEYLQVALGHFGGDGELDLTSFAMRMGWNPLVGRVLSIIGLAITLVVIGIWAVRHWQRRPQWSVQASPLGRVLLLTVLMMTALPFIYHHFYDAILMIMLVFAAFALGTSPARAASPGGFLPHLSGADVIVVIVMAVLLLPHNVVVRFFPAWGTIFPLLTGIITVAAWGVSLWMLWQAGDDLPVTNNGDDVPAPL